MCVALRACACVRTSRQASHGASQVNPSAHSYCAVHVLLPYLSYSQHSSPACMQRTMAIRDKLRLTRQQGYEFVFVSWSHTPPGRNADVYYGLVRLVVPSRSPSLSLGAQPANPTPCRAQPCSNVGRSPSAHRLQLAASTVVEYNGLQAGATMLLSLSCEACYNKNNHGGRTLRNTIITTTRTMITREQL